ncbi:MAG: amidohydrolase family protein [Bacteroidota bacterium]
MLNRLLIVACVLLFGADAALAQTKVLRAARMLDVNTGEVTGPARLLIEGDRIAAINPATLPADAEEIDLGDVTLLPGVMDMHTHLTMDLEGDWVRRTVTDTAVDSGLRGVRNARRTLMAGFTTVRNVGAGGFADISLKKAIDQDFFPGPRIVGAGHSLGITGGHCDATGYKPGLLENDYRQGIADGVDEVTKAVRYQIKHGAGVIKACVTAGVLSFEGPVGAQQYNQEELEAIVDEAALHGIKVAGHAHGAQGILAAVKAGFASIEHASILNDEIIAEMKAHGTYLVPTTYLVGAIDLDNLPPPIRAKAEFILPLAVQSLQKAIREGLNIAYGTDAAVIPHGENGKEFAVLVDRGMTPLAAIQTATINAADLLGVDDRGRLKEGLLADIIAIPGNPLDDISAMERVSFVMKGGKVYKE